jgi:RNA polymerase sigma-70 factor (ECF subfamily)
MDEKELVKKAQSGDFDAFNRLIADNKDKIYRLALKLSGNRDDAADIMQEAFLKAVDNIDKFRLESSFGTWLYSITLNAFRSRLDDSKKMPLKTIEEYLPAGHEQANSKLLDWGDPHELFEQKQIREMIESYLDEMPYKYSMPFVLRYMEDLPVKEVAALLKLSEAAAKSRILRARLALRDRLTDAFREKKSESLQ